MNDCEMIVPKNASVIMMANTYDFLLRYKNSLSATLISRGYSIAWVFPGESVSNVGNSSDGGCISLTQLNCPRLGISTLAAYFRIILRLSLVNRKHILVTHTILPNIAACLSYILLRPRYLKIAIFVSGFGPCRIRNSLRARLLGRVYLALLRYAAEIGQNLSIFLLNNDDLNLVQDYNPNRKCIVVRESGTESHDIANGFSAYSEKDYLCTPRLNVLFFGRFLLEKGLHDFAETIHLCKKLELSLDYVVAGSVDNGNSSSWSQELLSKNFIDVKVASEVGYKEMFQSAHILLFPSYREGHPLYLLRAMAYGVVPIVYRSAGSDVDVIHGYNGLISAGNSPNGLVSNLLSLTQDRQYLFTLASNCVNYARVNTQDSADVTLANHLTTI